ncbi:Hypothetical protein EIN_320040, partial [Entamoeba invadens IP1]
TPHHFCGPSTIPSQLRCSSIALGFISFS